MRDGRYDMRQCYGRKYDEDIRNRVYTGKGQKLTAHLSQDQRVGGSNPLAPTIFSTAQTPVLVEISL